MITTENKYKEHPFLSCFASWIVGSVDEMIDRGAIEYFKGGIENAIY